jgi:hypothetical protein
MMDTIFGMLFIFLPSFRIGLKSIEEKNCKYFRAGSGTNTSNDVKFDLRILYYDPRWAKSAPSEVNTVVCQADFT